MIKYSLLQQLVSNRNRWVILCTQFPKCIQPKPFLSFGNVDHVVSMVHGKHLSYPWFLIFSLSEDTEKLSGRSAVISHQCPIYATLIQFGAYYLIDCTISGKASPSTAQHTAIMEKRAPLLTVMFYRGFFQRYTEHKGVSSRYISPEPGRSPCCLLAFKASSTLREQESITVAIKCTPGGRAKL